MDIIRRGVYQIKCTVNNRVYIGSSFNIERRLRHHFKTLRLGTHHNYKLQADYARLGESMFVPSILEESSCKLRMDLYSLEQAWFDKTEDKYNILTDAKAHLDKRKDCTPKPRKKAKNKRAKSVIKPVEKLKPKKKKPPMDWDAWDKKIAEQKRNIAHLVRHLPPKKKKKLTR